MHNIGLIGCGNISDTFIQGIKESPDLQLRAVSSASMESMNRVGDQENVPLSRRYGDYRDLVESEDIDAVIICTPNNLHYEMAVRAIQCKKPFILEKPITTSLQSARKLMELTERSGIINSVNYSYRFFPAVRYLKHLIEQKTFGRIYHLYVQYFQGWAANSETVTLKRRLWRFSKDISGSGALGDLGTHMIDLTRFLIGEFREVSSDMDTFVKKRFGKDGQVVNVDVDDYVNFLGNLEGGVKANYGITRFASGRKNSIQLSIYGEKGGIVYIHDEKDSLRINLEQKHDVGDFKEVPVPEEFNISRMQSFADILNGNRNIVNPTISDGYKTQAVVSAILLANKLGRKVAIKD